MVQRFGASRAAMHAARDPYLRAPRAPPAGDCTRIRLPHCLSRTRPCTSRAVYSVRHGACLAAEAAWGLQPAAPAVSQGSSICQMQGGGGGNCTMGQQSSRAAATDAMCGAAPCAIVLPGPFTPGTAESYSGRRLASRRVCCARIVSPSAVCTAADDDTRTRSPRCPNTASSRPCTLRAAIRYATGHVRRRKQLGDCSQLHLPRRWGNSAGLVQVQAVEKYTIGQQGSSNQCDSSRCTVRSSPGGPMCPRNSQVMQR